MNIFLYGDHIDTDLIIPGRALADSSPQNLAAHCMQDLDPAFAGAVQPGDLLLAGENFGCGSSREHAPLALKASGICGVIAKSFARIFTRNAINIGLPILTCPAVVDAYVPGAVVTVDWARGIVVLNGKTFRIAPQPDFIQGIIAAGGLLNYAKTMDN